MEPNFHPCDKVLYWSSLKSSIICFIKLINSCWFKKYFFHLRIFRSLAFEGGLGHKQPSGYSWRVTLHNFKHVLILKSEILHMFVTLYTKSIKKHKRWRGKRRFQIDLFSLSDSTIIYIGCNQKWSVAVIIEKEKEKMLQNIEGLLNKMWASIRCDASTQTSVLVKMWKVNRPDVGFLGCDHESKWPWQENQRKYL